MTLRLPVQTRDWLRTALPLDLRALNIAAGVRAALASAVPVLLGELFAMPELSWLAVVAFWGCLADTGGAWTTRLLATGSFTLAATLGAMLGTLAQPYPWLAMPLAFCWCFFFSLIRVLGNEASTVGLLASLALLVPLGIPHDGTRDAADLGLLTLGGGLWSMLVALALWRIYPYGPARSASARAWVTLARFAAALAGSVDPATHDAVSDLDAHWSQIARDRRRQCREAIEGARAVLLATRRSRAGSSARGDALLFILAEAERLFGALIGINELLELSAGASAMSDADAALSRTLAFLAHRAEALERGIRGRAPLRDEAGTGTPGGQNDAFGERSFVLTLAAARDADAAHRHGAALALEAHRILASAADAVPALQKWRGPASGRPTFATGRDASIANASLRPSGRALMQAALRTLQANLKGGSLALRHALRLATTAAAAVLATAVIGSERGYWVTLTAVSVLQPYLATTWRRTLERVAGSVAGGIVAAFIGAGIAQPLTVTVLIFPLSVMTLALRSVNYTLYVMFLTPAFVLMAELFEGSLGKLDLALLRALDSVIGGVLGLAAAFLLWPSWERAHLPDQLIRAVAANRDFLERAIETVLRVSSGDARAPLTAQLDAARRQAGLASNNAEASLQRLIGEPASRGAERIEPAMALLNGLRRLAGISATLTLLPREALSLPDTGGKLEALQRQACNALSSAVEAVSGRWPDTVTGVETATSLEPMATSDHELLTIEMARAAEQTVLIAAAAARFRAADRTGQAGADGGT